MKKFIVRLFFVLSLFLIYFVVREFLDLYNALVAIDKTFALIITILLFTIILYFLISPLLKILTLPLIKGPVKNKNKVDALISQRLKELKKNKYLNSIEFDFDSEKDQQILYNKAMFNLKTECQNIRSKYIRNLFMSSAVSQNGFLDAILIFSSSVNLVKEIFVLYYGRVSNKDLLNIGKNIYFSMAIGGSEIVEVAGEELVSKAFEGVSQGIPFVGRLFGSVADGMVNALLLARISLITENYCTMTYIKSTKDLKPSPKFVINVTGDLTNDLLAKITEKLQKDAWFKIKESVGKVTEFILNPFKGEEKEESSDQIIKRHTKYAMIAAVAPLPVVDVVAITAVEMNMLWTLTKKYGIKWNKGLVKKIIGGGGIFGAASLGQSVWGSIAKTFPGIGTAAGGAIQMAIAGPICYSLGKAYAAFLEKGIDDIDDAAFDKELEKHLEEGKVVAGELKKEIPDKEKGEIAVVG